MRVLKLMSYAVAALAMTAVALVLTKSTVSVAHAA